MDNKQEINKTYYLKNKERLIAVNTAYRHNPIRQQILRERFIIELNNKIFKRIPWKKMEKMNISYNQDTKLFY